MKKSKLKLTRRPLKSIQIDAGKPYGSPTYLNPVASGGGTLRDIPSTVFVSARVTGRG